MKTILRQLQSYSYEVPKKYIAQLPASPRDAARLLVYNQTTSEIVADTFSHLAAYLPQKAVLVFNQSKVIPARLPAIKATGGRVNFLVLGRHGHRVTALVDRELHRGQRVQVGRRTFTVTSQNRAEFTLQMEFDSRRFPALLKKYGQTPIPPYIKHFPLTPAELRHRYQTVFAKQPGSAAAPTASLHFTKRLLSALQRHGMGIEFITLHVGLGTFAPVTAKHLQSGRLHEEQYEISPAVAARLNRSKAEGRPIIAVGTTVARALESSTRRGVLASGKKTTDIFIRPGYSWKFVDGLITNFHVPRSSLMMLVASLVGRQRLLALYAYAQRRRFRFFSFGDGMLIRS